MGLLNNKIAQAAMNKVKQIKAEFNQTVDGREVIKGLGKYAFQRSASAAAGTFGMYRILVDNPWKTSAIAIGAGALVAYRSPEGQVQTSAGPMSNQRRPGGANDNPYDLGASGDLVFALHRNR